MVIFNQLDVENKEVVFELETKNLALSQVKAEEDQNDDNSSIDSSDTTSDQSHNEEDDCNVVQSLSNTNDVNILSNIETASKYQVNEFFVARLKSNKRSLLYVG